MALTIDGVSLPLSGCGETVRVDGEDVGNVLVAPADLAATNLDDPTRPGGARADYRLDFPKSYAGDLAGAVVEVRGDLARVVGRPVRYAPELTPGDWNCTAWAASAPGDMTARVRVMAASATVDDEGEPVRVSRMVYEGPAQARMTGGSVTPGLGAERESGETWHFVVPWQDAFAELRPQAVSVERGGASYDAAYLRNVDEAGLFCDIQAVRHG